MDIISIIIILIIIMAKHVTHALPSLILMLILLFSIQSQETCDIVIVGGTLASLGAAIHAPIHIKLV